MSEEKEIQLNMEFVEDNDSLSVAKYISEKQNQVKELETQKENHNRYIEGLHDNIKIKEIKIKELEEQIKENDTRVLKNFIFHMPKVYRKCHSNWSIVGDILLRGSSTSGSTSCREKCIELGIDPESYSME